VRRSKTLPVRIDPGREMRPLNPKFFEQEKSRSSSDIVSATDISVPPSGLRR